MACAAHPAWDNEPVTREVVSSANSDQLLRHVVIVGGTPEAARRAASDGIAALRRTYLQEAPA